MTVTRVLRRFGPVLRAGLLATLAGLALYGALDGQHRWWLAPAGVAILAGQVTGRRPLAGAAIGAVAGLALFVPLLSWTNLHTGTVPWLLLAASQAAFVALLGAGGAAATPLLVRWWWLGPALTGGLWTGQEALRSRIPFGGFPWGRLAFSQVDSPLVALAALGGAPLVTFAVAAAGGALALPWRPRPAAGQTPTRLPARRAVLSRLAASAAAVLALFAAGALAAGAWIRPALAADAPTLTVAIVQGNVPRLGLDFNAQRRAVLDNHVEGTLSLARRVDQGLAPRPDLVVWPENSSDIDPLRNHDAASRIDQAAAAIAAPILVGALLHGADDTRVYNAGLLWVAGQGETDRYVKRHPVPFAETMPLRPIARLVSDQVDRLRVEFGAGTRPGVLTVRGLPIGDVICFEIAYDGLVRDVALGGARLIVTQTNNATFNRAEAAQQLAMVRLRAVEHGRPALMASTVGISAFVTPAGQATQATGFNRPAVIVERVRLARAATPATATGPLAEYLLAAATVAGLAGAWYLRRSSPGRPTRRPTRRDPTARAKVSRRDPTARAKVRWRA